MSAESQVIDANVNVGPTVYESFEFEPTFDALNDYLDAAAIDHAIVAPLAPPNLEYDEANARLADRVQHRDRFTGVARVDPRRATAREEARRALEEYGLAGLKLHPWEESFSITSNHVPPILDVAREAGVPVWIYAGYPHVSHALALRDIAITFPDVRFVLTHGAQLDISGLSLGDAMLLAADTTNTYFELSGVYRRDLIEDLVAEVGPDRVMFGSNSPYFHPQVEKTRVTAADIDDEQRRQILGGTIRDLLNWS